MENQEKRKDNDILDEKTKRAIDYLIDNFNKKFFEQLNEFARIFFIALEKFENKKQFAKFLNEQLKK